MEPEVRFALKAVGWSLSHNYLRNIIASLGIETTLRLFFAKKKRRRSFISNAREASGKDRKETLESPLL